MSDKLAAPPSIGPLTRETLPPPQGRQADDRQGFLCFTIGDEEYGVDLNMVRQIVKPPPVAWVPRTPSHILGVISIRGAVVTLLDLGLILGHGPCAWPRTARVLIVDMWEEQVGVLVDAVTQVRRLDPSALEAGAALSGCARSENVRYVARPGGGALFTIVDLDAILGERLK
ncbi:MAG: chemotaxis protein CheW [Deltaproteobacteria bacterium]|nr:chemotaxis protein CheW [Deltaproteobacteria bacterium]